MQQSEARPTWKGLSGWLGGKWTISADGATELTLRFQRSEREQMMRVWGVARARGGFRDPCPDGLMELLEASNRIANEASEGDAEIMRDLF